MQYISLNKLPSTFRSFIAIEIDKTSILKKIEKYQEELQKSIGPLKLVNTSLMHITLHFLGDITHEQALSILEFLNDKINKDIKTINENNQDLYLNFKGTDDFRERVFFIKANGSIDYIFKIHRELKERLNEIGGIKIDSRPFKVHLTVARAKRFGNRKYQNKWDNENKKNIGQLSYSDLKAKYKEFDFGSQPITKVLLKYSKLMPKGPEYYNITF